MILNIKNIALSIVVSCLMISSVNAATSSATMGVTANILGSCSVTATDMDFGNVDLSIGAESTSQINLNCPIGTDVRIYLNGGLHLTNDERYVSQTIGNDEYFVNYNLYMNSDMNSEYYTFQDSENGYTYFTIDEVTNSTIVYGQIPSQETKPSGVYNDTINVLVTY